MIDIKQLIEAFSVPIDHAVKDEYTRRSRFVRDAIMESGVSYPDAAKEVEIDPGLFVIYGDMRSGKSTLADRIAEKLDGLFSDKGINAYGAPISIGEPDADVPMIASVSDVIAEMAIQTASGRGIPLTEDVTKHRKKKDGSTEDYTVTQVRGAAAIIADVISDATRSARPTICVIDSLSTLPNAEEVASTPALEGGELSGVLGYLTVLNNVAKTLNMYAIAIWNPGDYHGPMPNFSGCVRGSIFTKREGDTFRAELGHIRRRITGKKWATVTASWTNSAYFGTHNSSPIVEPGEFSLV